MKSVTFIKNCTSKNSLFYKDRLQTILNKNYANFDMSEKLKLPVDNTEALIYLRDRFIVDENLKYWESPYKAEKIIDGTIKRQTIENWAKKFSQLIRPKPDSKPFMVWLPDVVFCGTIMKAFEALENNKIVQQQAVREGVVMYKYANMSDEITKKTILETKGGVVIDIMSSILDFISLEAINQVSGSEASLTKAHQSVIAHINKPKP